MPQPRQRDYASPSSAALFQQCMLRVAYASDPEFSREVPSSPAARLGTACHRILELAGSSGLPPPDSAGWREAFERAWDEAISVEEAAAHEHPLETHWPPAERWRGYAVRKVRTRRLAEQLASNATAVPKEKPEEGAGLQLEQKREGFGGKLRGRPDVVRGTGQDSVIEDYKTGAVYEAGTEEVKAAYTLQLLLYAALERETTGECPRAARLIPLEGAPATIDIREEEAVKAARTAIAALDEYNAEVERGTSPERLADASPDHCRFCPFAVRCPGFWSAADRDWAAEGILAAAGDVTASESSRFDTFDLDGDIEAGSVPGGHMRLHGLDLDRFGPALQAGAGSSFAATGLRPGADNGVVQPTARTRLIVARHPG